MKKTFADICLERAEKATVGPWTHSSTCHQVNHVYSEHQGFIVSDLVGSIAKIRSGRYEFQKLNGEFIAHARTDVPELARRLNKSIEIGKNLAMALEQRGFASAPLLVHLLELEKVEGE